ncbi:MAG: hypothetical protein NZ578_16315 [Candidatus Binatia bacterium]|nr:hypothetical protein [Candidatus Binatia bacterium]
MRTPERLLHPSLGELPARRILDCIFALSPTGNILHYHIEQVNKTDLPPAEGAGIRYTLTDQPAALGRERCRIIPPLVREFDPVERPPSGGATS